MFYKVAEHFVSINGESRFAGELAVFIRFAGCNLSCTYCDTAWAIADTAPYTQMNLEEIIEYVDDSGIVNVTLTGGEPLIQDGINILIDKLIKNGNRVEIETNGAVSLKGVMEAGDYGDRLSVTLDYKCPTSGMESSMIMDNYDYLRPYDNVKFVVGSKEDLDKAAQITDSYKLKDKGVNIYLSPVFGKLAPVEIVEYMKETGMNGVKLQLQQHKFIWDPNQKGV